MVVFERGAEKITEDADQAEDRRLRAFQPLSFKPGIRRSGSRALGLFDDDRIVRHVLMARLVTGRHRLDLIHHIHATDHLAEDCVTPAVLPRIVEEAVVPDIDEELRRSGVRVGSAAMDKKCTAASGGLIEDLLALNLLEPASALLPVRSKDRNFRGNTQRVVPRYRLALAAIPASGARRFVVVRRAR